MKVRELFDRVGDPTFVFGGPLFDRGITQIKHVDVCGDIGNAATLILKDSNDVDWRAHIRVRGEFTKIASALLSWAQSSQVVLGLTLDQLEDVETGLDGDELLKQK